MTYLKERCTCTGTLQVSRTRYIDYTLPGASTATGTPVIEFDSTCLHSNTYITHYPAQTQKRNKGKIETTFRLDKLGNPYIGCCTERGTACVLAHACPSNGMSRPEQFLHANMGDDDRGHRSICQSELRYELILSRLQRIGTNPNKGAEHSQMSFYKWVRRDVKRDFCLLQNCEPVVKWGNIEIETCSCDRCTYLISVSHSSIITSSHPKPRLPHIVTGILHLWIHARKVGRCWCSTCLTSSLENRDGASY